MKIRWLTRPRSVSTRFVISGCIRASPSIVTAALAGMISTSNASLRPRARDAQRAAGIDGQDRAGDAPGIAARHEKYVSPGEILGLQRDAERVVGAQLLGH